MVPFWVGCQSAGRVDMGESGYMAGPGRRWEPAGSRRSCFDGAIRDTVGWRTVHWALSLSN